MDKKELGKKFGDVTFMDIDLVIVESKAQTQERVDKIAKMMNSAPVCVEHNGSKLKIALSNTFMTTYAALRKGQQATVTILDKKKKCEIVSDEPFWCNYEKCARVRFEDSSEDVFDITNIEI